MVKLIRYTLAALCLAASVGCLALWWRSYYTSDRYIGPSYSQPPRTLFCDTIDGVVVVGMASRTVRTMTNYSVVKGWDIIPPAFLEHRTVNGAFGTYGDAVYFPLWYPALVFALAGVGILRVGRFTIRSALIATTIMAALLGMVVVL